MLKHDTTFAPGDRVRFRDSWSAWGEDTSIYTVQDIADVPESECEGGVGHQWVSLKDYVHGSSLALPAISGWWLEKVPKGEELETALLTLIRLCARDGVGDLKLQMNDVVADGKDAGSWTLHLKKNESYSLSSGR